MSLGWLTDKVYDFVASEGDRTLQFFADFIRGPGNHNKQNMKSSDEKVLKTIITRQREETKDSHKKRKDFVENYPDKRILTARYNQLLKEKHIESDKQDKKQQQMDDMLMKLRVLRTARTNHSKKTHSK